MDDGEIDSVRQIADEHGFRLIRRVGVSLSPGNVILVASLVSQYLRSRTLSTAEEAVPRRHCSRDCTPQKGLSLLYGTQPAADQLGRTRVLLRPGEEVLALLRGRHHPVPFSDRPEEFNRKRCCCSHSGDFLLSIGK